MWGISGHMILQPLWLIDPSLSTPISRTRHTITNEFYRALVLIRKICNTWSACGAYLGLTYPYDTTALWLFEPSLGTVISRTRHTITKEIQPLEKKLECELRLTWRGIERRALSQEIDVNILAANIREGTQAALDEAAVLGARLQELDQREK
jgi:hypothetical protein